jgi:LysM repeat protein
MKNKTLFLMFGPLLCLSIAISSVSAEDSSALHRIRTCEIELEMLKNSISTQEQARESLEREVSGLLKATRESMKETRESTSTKQSNIDKALEKVTQDCKQLKNHSNELSKVVNDLSKTVQGMKESSQQQAQAIRELEQALRTITLAMGAKPPKVASSDKGSSYIVKNGDSLEKIARAHGMTLNEIKDLNGLKQSKIHPGQELRVRNP